MTRFLCVFVYIICSNYAAGQITQTIRGTILDEDGKFPLIGANVYIAGSDPVIGTTTDLNGTFRIEKIPVGRVDIAITYLGYEEKVIPNILISSGKEVILDLEMRESLLKMEEVVISATKNKGEVLNEMAMISSRSFSVEETKRYAGALQDPSRMVSAFAGVSSDPEGNNDIVVRGNSPKGILWRVEGIEIPNPNHFSDEGATGGPINALNSELLANSDFYTGAFAPEYGDVLSGVFDIHLRSGNNEKREYSIGVGVLGTDLTLEGPFSKKYRGSYLLNYRYSSLALLSEAGIVDFDGIPKYQDMTFKFSLPTKHTGTFSIFGIGGISHILANEQNDTGKVTEKDDYGSKMGVVGINHIYSFTQNTFIKTTLAISGNGSNYSYEKPDSLDNFIFQGEGHWEKSSLRSAFMFSSKINAKNRLVTGIKYANHYYDLYEYYYDDDLKKWAYGTNMKKEGSIWNSYISWKSRITEDITLLAGIHGIYYSLNRNYNIEPRIGMQWQINGKQAVNFGYGLHSKSESIVTYYTMINTDEGEAITPNRNLELSKARHYVLGYEYRFSKNLLSKFELYYQDLYNIPVENLDTSYFTMLNSDEGYINKVLVNEGTGQNYGIEFTLEHFFSKGFYFLLTSSLYESKYKSKEGITRNTKYNGNYSVNFLAGKEFNLSKKTNKKVLGINTKLFINGGRRYIPVDVELSRSEGQTRYDFSKAWNERLDHMMQVNLAITYRIDRPKASHEFIIDVINLTNAKGRVWEYYDETSGNVEYDRQLNMIPNIMYRINF